LVQLLLRKIYAIESWFNFPPHLFSLRALPWETFKTPKNPKLIGKGTSFRG